MTEPRVSLAGSLLRSHMIVAAIGMVPLVVALIATVTLNRRAEQLADVRAPAALAAAQAYAGVQRSTSSLRGWIAVGNEAQREDRAAAWEEDIWPALDALSASSDGVADAGELRAVLVALEESQFWIEDVAQAPGNEPARDLLQRDVDPVARAIDERTAGLVDRLGALPPTRESAESLAALNEMRSSFQSSRSSLSRFVAEGREEHETAFLTHAERAGERLATLAPSALVPVADVTWLGAELPIYVAYGSDCLAARRAPSWNRAHQMLAADAMPFASRATEILRDETDRQNALVRSDVAAVSRVSNIALVVGLTVALVMFAVAFWVSRRSAHHITAPVVRLSRATRKMAEGEESEDLRIDMADEIGALTSDFNAMKASLEAKDKEVRLAVEASPSGLLMVDQKGTIILVNEQIEKLFGYARAEIVGQSIAILLPGRNREAHGALVAGFVAAPKRRGMGQQRELFGCRKDGSEFPVEIGLNPTFASGRMAVLASVVDVTERRAYEEEMRLAKEAAETANRTKSEFLANMSHELRTPLNSVIGFSNILLKNKKGNLEEKQIDHLERVRNNGVHLLGLIDDVLDLSKIEAGHLELLVEDVDLTTLVENTVAELQGRAATAQLTLSAEIPADVDHILTDRVRLKQVLINLVGNALKFTREGGVTARVIVEKGSHRALRVEVQDTGVGIPKEKLSLVFEAFRQADATTSREFGGTGLGLAISSQLCERMGCLLEAESVVGEGSTFRIVFGESTVPASKSVRPRPAEAPLPKRQRPAKRRVLVIDDQEESRILVGDCFEELGWEVELADGGHDGLRRARANRPDVLTVDLMMPTMSGWQVVREIRKDPDLRDLQVIVISQVANSWRAALTSEVELLQKPIDAAALRRSLDALGPARGSVLIVDDDPDVRTLLRTQVEEWGHVVVEARNGREGLEALEAELPSVVLLDLMMPKVDGFEFLRRVAEVPEYANLPVVVISAKELDHDDRERIGRRQILPKGDHLESDLRNALSSLPES